MNTLIKLAYNTHLNNLANPYLSYQRLESYFSHQQTTNIEQTLLYSCYDLYFKNHKRHIIRMDKKEHIANTIYASIISNLNNKCHPYRIDKQKDSYDQYTREDGIIDHTSWDEYVNIGKKYFIRCRGIPFDLDLWTCDRGLMVCLGDFNKILACLNFLLLKDNFLINQKYLEEYKKENQ